MKSFVELNLEEGAVLQFAFEPKLYPLVRTAWEGLACWNYSPCIYAYKVSDIAITGKGTMTEAATMIHGGSGTAILTSDTRRA